MIRFLLFGVLAMCYCCVRAQQTVPVYPPSASEADLRAHLDSAIRLVTGPTDHPRDTALLAQLFHPSVLFATFGDTCVQRWTLPQMLLLLHNNGQTPSYSEHATGLQVQVINLLARAQWRYTSHTPNTANNLNASSTTAGTNHVTLLHDGTCWRIMAWTWDDAPANAGAEPPPLDERRAAQLDTSMRYAYASISHAKGQCPDTALVRRLYSPGARMGFIGRDSTGVYKGIQAFSIDDYIAYLGAHFTEHAFYERETAPRTVWRYRNTALVWSPYAYGETTNGNPTKQGVNVYHCVYDGTRWQIIGVFWDTLQ
jgi:hypothetical protein